MESSENFLDQKFDEITEKGILVIDGVRRMPVYGEPYISPHYIISINHSGMLFVEYDGQQMQYEPHDIAVVYPRHVLISHGSSDDYLATLVIVSEKLFAKLHALNVGTNRFNYENLPHFNLTDQQYSDMLSLVEALRIISRLPTSGRGEMLIDMLDIMIRTIDIFMSEKRGGQNGKMNRISQKLLEAIISHSHQHHDVDFYASLFCLSPKYFSCVIKKETGRSARYWIHKHIIANAKVLLRTQPQYSLQEISESLGFSELSSFSRFFKRETGCSPSAYRQESFVHL